MCRSISCLSFLTTARPRRSASRRSQMIDSASTRLPLTRMSIRTRSAGKIADQLVVHRAVAAGGALELVVQVVNHFGQRQVVDVSIARVGDRYSVRT